MNYRHIYHAGNFADLMKHLVLVALLKKLSEKDKPFTVLDAFAGIGIYDLSSEEAQKTKEYENGIGMLSRYLESCHPRVSASKLEDDGIASINTISSYLSTIHSLGLPDLYPGSPYIISQLLREHDELIASELHPQDYAQLKYNMSPEKNTAIHHMDGYNAIKAFLPPKNPKNLRGLVLLDAAFEVKNEYLKIIEALKLIKKRFAAGIVMIWYPIKDSKLVQEFYSTLKETGYPEFLKVEFEIGRHPREGGDPDNIELDSRLRGNDIENGMNKCGVIIANPPYIKDDIENLMRFLCYDIYHGKAKMNVHIIK